MSIPEAALALRPASVSLRVSPDLVERFATLTGDRNLLHTDEAFARRSSYRRTVMHGLLPVSFLPLLPAFQLAGFRCALVGVSGQFTSPVYTNTTLTIGVGAPRVAQDARLEFDYTVERAPQHEVVTSGTVAVSYTPHSTTARPAANARVQGSLLTQQLASRHWLWEDIETGTRDQLEFLVTDAVVSEFSAMLSSAVDAELRESAAHVAHTFYVPNLLSVLLYSTSLGVSLPGTSATFLQFSAAVEQPIQLDTPYTMRGQIVHRSAATRIIKKELLVSQTGTDETVVRGKASTLVAQAFRRMPSVEELRHSGTDFGLRDKVVVITGASRGIGETTAKLFALHGAKVVVNYRHGAADAKRVVDEIRSGGGDAVAIAADVTDANQVRALITQVREQYGTVDVLVNNAARDFRPIAFSKLTWEEIQADIDVIVKGAFLCCHETIPLMLERGAGRIINISTIATDDPPPDQTKYVVAKSALVGLTRSLAAEFASRNIQVNLVVPNFVETDLVAHIPEGFRKKIAQDIPMRRVGTALDVARAVVFLASAYSSFTTGQKVMVTGGGPPYV